MYLLSFAGNTDKISFVIISAYAVFVCMCVHHFEYIPKTNPYTL